MKKYVCELMKVLLFLNWWQCCEVVINTSKLEQWSSPKKKKSYVSDFDAKELAEFKKETKSEKV